MHTERYLLAGSNLIEVTITKKNNPIINEAQNRVHMTRCTKQNMKYSNDEPSSKIQTADDNFGTVSYAVS